MTGSDNRGGFGPEVKNKLQAVLDTDPFSTAFTAQNIPSAIEKFVDRGDTVEALLLRGHFRNVNHKNACVRLLRKAKHFEDKELEEMILNSIAGDPAIHGERIYILLQAVVGAIQERKKSFGNRFKDAFGMNNDKPG